MCVSVQVIFERTKKKDYKPSGPNVPSYSGQGLEIMPKQYLGFQSENSNFHMSVYLRVSGQKTGNPSTPFKFPSPFWVPQKFRNNPVSNHAVATL